MSEGADRARKPSWFAKLDRPIAVTDGRPVRHRRLAIALTLIATVLGLVLVRSADYLFGYVGLLVVGVGSLAFVVGCVIWRRRRNRELTGSPTRWPDQDL